MSESGPKWSLGVAMLLAFPVGLALGTFIAWAQEAGLL